MKLDENALRVLSNLNLRNFYKNFLFEIVKTRYSSRKLQIVKKLSIITIEILTVKIR